jgi:hypothetical protein
MKKPTTRTEQMLASASKGVSPRLMLSEAAGFVETGKIFVAGPHPKAHQECWRAMRRSQRDFKRDHSVYVRPSSSFRLGQSLSNPL